MRSSPPAVPKSGRARSALILSATVFALVAAAPGAHAAFSLAACTGSAINGRGASFQASAQQGFIGNFQTADFCGAGAPAITYDAAGSGAGRRALGERSGTNTTGARDAAIRFGGTDEPPTPTQTAQMESGPVDGSLADVTAADNGDLHVVPVAIGANAVDVNYPDGCSIPAASLANPPASGAAQTDRIKLTATVAEAAFYADTSADTWGELVPGIAGTPTNTALVDAGVATCASVPVRRVVRFDDSGTTFVQKDWLGKVNPARSPSWASFQVNPNTTWPNALGGTPAATCPVLATNLCKNTSNGAGALLDLLNTVDGGIGYADVATSRSKGFEVVPSTGDTTFWAPIVNTAATPATFEPTADATAWKSGTGTRGANCAGTVFSSVPGGSDPTLGSWAAVSGVGTASAAFYPICSLTYAMVFDDNASVYGASAAEEGKARTVKDYLTSQVSALGQTTLSPRDYAPLSLALRSGAQTGVGAINWNKSAGGTTTPPPPPPPLPPPPPPPPPPAGPPPPPPPPSNVFTFTSIKTSSTTRTASLKLSLQVPGAGKLGAVATSSYRKGSKTTKVAVGRASGTATAAGTVSVTIRLGAKARAALRKAKRLVVLVKVTYTPTGGTANTKSKSATLRVARKK